jgi:hypothetical protein
MNIGGIQDARMKFIHKHKLLDANRNEEMIDVLRILSLNEKK